VNCRRFHCAPPLRPLVLLCPCPAVLGCPSLARGLWMVHQQRECVSQHVSFRHLVGNEVAVVAVAAAAAYPWTAVKHHGTVLGYFALVNCLPMPFQMPVAPLLLQQLLLAPAWTWLLVWTWAWAWARVWAWSWERAEKRRRRKRSSGRRKGVQNGQNARRVRWRGGHHAWLTMRLALQAGHWRTTECTGVRSVAGAVVAVACRACSGVGRTCLQQRVRGQVLWSEPHSAGAMDSETQCYGV